MSKYASLRVLIPVVALFATSAARADDEAHWTLGVSGGSLGIGPEVAYRFNSHAGLRGNAGFYSYSHNDDLDDLNYDADLKLESYGLMADWYPTGGGFRISAGVRSNDNHVELFGTPTTSVQIGNTTYTPAQVGTLTGTIETNSLAPALTLGYGGSFRNGFTLGFELGVMFQGSPTVENLKATGLLASNTTFQTNLRQEELNVESDAKDFRYWPILQLHFLYRF